jgi:hypothetical protein
MTVIAFGLIARDGQPPAPSCAPASRSRSHATTRASEPPPPNSQASGSRADRPIRRDLRWPITCRTPTPEWRVLALRADRCQSRTVIWFELGLRPDRCSEYSLPLGSLVLCLGEYRTCSSGSTPSRALPGAPVVPADGHGCVLPAGVESIVGSMLWRDDAAGVSLSACIRGAVTVFCAAKLSAGVTSTAPRSEATPAPGRRAGQDCRKASRSASIVSAWGNPLYVFSVPFCRSRADSGPESA